LTSTHVPASRVLDWQGCRNVRDLGGLVAGDGKRIRWGALVRSDLPTRLTETGRRSLIEHGIKSIVDVRFADELVADGETYPFRGVAGAESAEDHPQLFHTPFDFSADDGPDSARHAAYAAADTRAAIIRIDLDLNQPGIGKAVAAIADAPPGGVLIHCHAGKDRTGIIVALILSLLGAADDEIAADYALTQASLEGLLDEWLDQQSDDPQERKHLRDLIWPSAEAMLGALDHLRARYQSAADYLRGGGVTEQQIDRLRERLLEDG
jgi:protein tyrosine/serine phosphatase